MTFMQTWGQFIVLMLTMVGMTGAMWRATNRRIERLEDRLDRLEVRMERFEVRLAELGERLARLETKMDIVIERLLPATASSD